MYLRPERRPGLTLFKYLVFPLLVICLLVSMQRNYEKNLIIEGLEHDISEYEIADLKEKRVKDSIRFKNKMAEKSISPISIVVKPDIKKKSKKDTIFYKPVIRDTEPIKDTLIKSFINDTIRT